MGDVYALRSQLARRALRQAAQSKLAHRERRRVRIPLDAGAGAGQQDRAAAMGNHAPGSLLDSEKAAKCRDPDRFAHSFRVELGNRTMPAGAGVVVHDIGFAEPLIRLGEQAGHRSRIRRVDGKGLRTYFCGERRQLFDITRR